MAHSGYLNGVLQLDGNTPEANVGTNLVKARSPILLTLTTTDTFTNINIKLYFGTGLFSEISSTPDYEFSESSVNFASRKSFTYDLSNYAREYLQNTSLIDYDYMSCWMKIKVTAEDNSGVITTPYDIYSICMDGYLDFEDVDASFSSSTVFSDRDPVQLYLPSDTILINQGSSYILPVINPNELYTSVCTTITYDDFKSYKITYNTGTFSITNIAGGIGSGDPLCTDIFEPATFSFIASSTEATIDCYDGFDATGTLRYSYTIKERDCTKYDKYEIGFIDKNGTYAYLHCDGVSQFTQTISRDEYSKTNLINDTGGWNLSRPQYKAYNINGNETMTVNTGWVPESYKEVIRQLLLSPVVFINGTSKLPIIPISNSIDMKQSVNEGLINYTISFKRAYNTVNNLF